MTQTQTTQREKTAQRTEQYKVLNKIAEAPGVATLVLTLAKGGIPRFTAGQFITVYFPETGIVEGKAYSISSAPNEPSLSITARAIGEFSNRLCAMEPGDLITASLPYGYFSSANEDGSADAGDLILIAAGIGITPFRSIIRDAVKKNPARKIALFYTARNVADMVFKNEFDTLKKANQNFATHYFATRESDMLPSVLNRRMRPEDVFKACGTMSGGDFKNPEVLICGSIPFVRDFWQGLRAGGVSEEAIYTEAFFS